MVTCDVHNNHWFRPQMQYKFVNKQFPHYLFFFSIQWTVAFLDSECKTNLNKFKAWQIMYASFSKWNSLSPITHLSDFFEVVLINPCLIQIINLCVAHFLNSVHCSLEHNYTTLITTFVIIAFYILKNSTHTHTHCTTRSKTLGKGQSTMFIFRA
jgi:hypothetical protein